MKDVFVPEANIGKFKDPVKTADGQARARVALTNPETLWFNTGTRCNITCLNCYIESSPENDRLQYVNREEVRDYLDQIDERKWPIREIAYTGGEPFMNPHMIGLARDPLARGFDVLILTNAMKPMMRPIMQEGLRCLRDDFGDKLT
ncbi:MAG: radical SAM protein, partial [Pseudomonadota bacterium]